MNENTRRKLLKYAFDIVSGIFEDFLQEKGITFNDIPNKERDEYLKDDQDIYASILFGDDYYYLEDKVLDILEKVVESKGE